MLKVISAERIESQGELAARLRDRGFDATQASISRDLDELGILKSGGIYTIPSRPAAASVFGMRKLDRSGDSLIVAKCDPGLASAAAVRIDAAKMPEIVGTIAGDDTIFIAVRDEEDLRPAMKKIWELFDE